MYFKGIRSNKLRINVDLLVDRSVWACGSNRYTQLGVVGQPVHPLRLPFFDNLPAVRFLRLGTTFTLVVLGRTNSACRDGREMYL